MPKKVLQAKSSNMPLRQGKISAFVKKQSAADLLKSKDGLKQGRIEAFMKKKSECTNTNIFESTRSRTPSKRRRASTEEAIPETPSPKVQKILRKSPRLSAKKASAPVIDLTGEHHSGNKKSKSPKAKESLFGRLNSKKTSPVINLTDVHHSIAKKSKSLKPKESFLGRLSKNSPKKRLAQVADNDDGHTLLEIGKDRCKSPKPSSKAENNHKRLGNDFGTELNSENILENSPSKVQTQTNSSGFFELSERTQPSEETEDLFNLSADDMCLNDSFLNAALDDISPVKENTRGRKESEPKLLPFSIPCASTSHSLAKYRYKVSKVSEMCDPGGFERKVLDLENVAAKAKISCELHEGWIDTKVGEGDIVNIVASENEASCGKVKIDTKKNLLILHPDVLLSGTTVSNAIACKRRAVLSERFKNTESGDCGKPVMLIGTIIHSLFQTVVQERQKFSHEKILSLAEKEISKSTIMKDILALGTSQKDVLNGVKEFIPAIIKWTGEFVRDSPTIGVGQLDMKLPPGYQNEELGVDDKVGNSKFRSNVALTEVRDIEENVWSPLYGLKGKIDLTGGFLIRRQASSNKSHCAKVVLPLELKTGRESHSTEHHGQVAIYSMFCKLRRNNINNNGTIPAGLLLYLKTGSMSCIPLKRDDERELTMIRNDVASYMARATLQKSINNVPAYESASLPPTVDNERFCTNCSQLRNCSLVYKSVDTRQSTYTPSHSMMELINEQTSHLSAKDLEYFNHWMTCTLLESRKSMKDDIAQYYWLRSPEERENAGSCVTHLVLAGHGKQSEDGVTSLQTFKRSAVCHTLQSNFGIFNEGDMIVVSGEEPAFTAMASGTVSSVSENFLTIVTDRKFDGYPKAMKYSIDKHQWSSMNSFNPSYHNLSVIMQPSVTANHLRDLIIHHRDPTFKHNLQEVVPRSSKDEIAKMLRGLNRTQRQAIKRVLLSNDYTLVVGMPGSGKTTTIVAMVRILLLCGCRVLLTSYTHSAIDNLLMKLIKYKVKFLRLGRTSQIHPSVQKFSEQEMTKNFTTPEELDKLYSEAKVVGCTCLAVTSHALFTSNGTVTNKRSHFDICIVDEASQISQPACLAPLLHADRFVLVGDHRQLPPLVRSRKARSIGADESLFWRLTSHTDALCDLTLQYRMNSAIMEVSNYVTYEGRLECATEATALAELSLPAWKDISELINQKSHTTTVNNCDIVGLEWLLASLNPERPVMFLDTSKLKAYEEEVENGICNKTEAEILKIIADYLIQAGCSAENIGVITPFRKQLKAIEERLALLKADAEKVEINTVDKYQGRDKSVILMSFVRSRSGELGDTAGEILSDWRRLNVALTRAKHKMLLVGCQKTLNAYEPCKKLLNYLNEKHLIVTL